MVESNLPVRIAALYHFARFADPAALRAPLLALCAAQGIRGTLLLAREGINGTIAGSADGIAAVLEHVRALPGCAALEAKFAHAERLPFARMKVRLKQEIVTMGEPDIDPLEAVGHYVEPEDWNALIADPATIVIDTRNDYEVAIGTFARAVDPKTRTFREFPAWFHAHRDELLGTDGPPPRIAMFCTGGIRCEKSTAFVKAQGLDAVYHLKGGILKYLETVPADQSLWQGECYVFDDRVSVGHGLVPGDFTQCEACGRPVGADGRASALYEAGVSCPACHDAQDAARRERLRLRRRQLERTN